MKSHPNSLVRQSLARFMLASLACANAGFPFSEVPRSDQTHDETPVVSVNAVGFLSQVGPSAFPPRICNLQSVIDGHIHGFHIKAMALNEFAFRAL